MRSDMVVPVAEYIEVIVELYDVRHQPLVELVFEGAEQAFDPAVLPWATRCCALVTDAELLECAVKSARSEHTFVVGADDFGFAVGTNGLYQATEYGVGGFIMQRLKV